MTRYANGKVCISYFRKIGGSTVVNQVHVNMDKVLLSHAPFSVGILKMEYSDSTG